LQEVQVALERFTQYSTLWEKEEKEREADILEFVQQNPQLSEFEQQIRFYEQLEEQFMAEADRYNVGPIAIYTG
jgi:dynein heavy chain